MAKQAQVHLTNGEVYFSAAIGVACAVLTYAALTHFVPDERAEDAYKLFGALCGAATFCISTMLFRRFNY
jgi:hypothetical protein